VGKGAKRHAHAFYLKRRTMNAYLSRWARFALPTLRRDGAADERARDSVPRPRQARWRSPKKPKRRATQEMLMIMPRRLCRCGIARRMMSNMTI
jgi:hypothetical protein